MRAHRATRASVHGAVGAIFGVFLLATPAHAGNCQEDVDALRKEIKQDKAKFKKDALDAALDHLRKAEFHRINPLECRQEVLAARTALRGCHRGPPVRPDRRPDTADS